MKIGLLGAPGAGKSKLAKALAKNLDGAVVVDNYVQRLQKRTSLALGPWASYSENLMIAGVREAERKAKPGEHQITVGTMMDTMAYVMLYSDVVMHRQDRHEAMTTYYEAQAVVNGLSMWYTQTWDYDLCFYLSIPDSDTDRIEDRFALTLDQTYPTIVEAFYVPAVYELLNSSERVNVAREIIEIAERDEAERSGTATDPSSDEERSVRSGDEDGADVGDPPRPMSNVPGDQDRGR